MFSFTYRLWGTGWATMMVAEGDVSREMTISYIGPDINDLLWAAGDLLAGRKMEREVKFEGEESDHHWKLKRVGDDVVVRILSVIEIEWDEASDEDPVKDRWEHEFTMPARHFGRQVLFAFDRMIDEFGEEGYRKKWLREMLGQGRVDEARRLVAP